MGEIVSPNEKPKFVIKSDKPSKNSLKLSELLTRRRKELDLSLDDIERNTRIGKKYLKLLEAGEYSNLPNDVYTRGYVKNYADFLGFDTKEIIKLYSKERHEYESGMGLKSKNNYKLGLKPKLYNYPKDYIICPDKCIRTHNGRVRFVAVFSALSATYNSPSQPRQEQYECELCNT